MLIEKYLKLWGLNNILMSKKLKVCISIFIKLKNLKIMV
jgi:hypothetical protein